MTSADAPDTSATGGLRERKKAATMHHVQSVALDLFDEHGFDSVTVEQVAAVAEVSPRTVYRYFGTKEGLVVADEFDEDLLDGVLERLPRMDLHLAFTEVMAEFGPAHFVRDAELTMRRARYIFEVPAVRGAGLLAIDRAVAEITAAWLAHGRPPIPDPVSARAQTSALIWGIMGGLDGWYEQGAREPIFEVLMRVLSSLRPPD